MRPFRPGKAACAAPTVARTTAQPARTDKNFRLCLSMDAVLFRQTRAKGFADTWLDTTCACLDFIHTSPSNSGAFSTADGHGAHQLARTLCHFAICGNTLVMTFL